MADAHQTEIKIERGVPMPRRGCGLFGRPPKYPWLAMETGDSFLVTGISRPSISRMACAFGRRHGLKFATRKQPDGSIRVWRIA